MAGLFYQHHAELLAAMAGIAAVFVRMVRRFEAVDAAEKSWLYAQQLLNTATDQFHQAHQMKVEIAPAALADLASEIITELRAVDYHECEEGSVFDALDRLAHPRDGGPSVESIRNRLVNLINDPFIQVAMAARKAAYLLHQRLADLTPRDFLRGDGVAYTALMRQAADHWVAGQQAELFSGRVKFGTYDPALVAGGKPADQIRRAAMALLGPGRQPGVTLAEELGFTAPDIEVLRKVEQRYR